MSGTVPFKMTCKDDESVFHQVADVLTDCRPFAGASCLLYHVNMTLTCPLPEEQNTRGRKIYPPEESPQGFGILTLKRISKVRYTNRRKSQVLSPFSWTPLRERHVLKSWPLGWSFLHDLRSLFFLDLSFSDFYAVRGGWSDVGTGASCRTAYRGTHRKNCSFSQLHVH